MCLHAVKLGFSSVKCRGGNRLDARTHGPWHHVKSSLASMGARCDIGGRDPSRCACASIDSCACMIGSPPSTAAAYQALVSRGPNQRMLVTVVRNHDCDAGLRNLSKSAVR